MGRTLRHMALTVLALFGFHSVLQAASPPIKVYELPEGDLSWSTERPQNARLCVPAAFTDTEGNVQGEYRLGGVIHHPNKRLKVSILKDIFYVDSKWHSDTGFQQLILVYNNKTRRFRDERKFIRRALCKKDRHVFIVESTRRMTLNEFAEECGKISSNAVYLDMGEYGYGYVEDIILSPWAYFSRNKQTNWLYIK